MGRKRRRSEDSEDESQNRPSKRVRGAVWRVPEALDSQVLKACSTLSLWWALIRVISLSPPLSSLPPLSSPLPLLPPPLPPSLFSLLPSLPHFPLLLPSLPPPLSSSLPLLPPPLPLSLFSLLPSLPSPPSLPPSPSPPPSLSHTSAHKTDLCATLLNALRKCKAPDGSRNLGDFLTRVPSRRVCPEYYDNITQPIDLMRIQHKVVTDEYVTITAFLSDVQLLLSNTRQYYGPASEEYQQVNDLEVAFAPVLSEHGIGVEPPGSGSGSGSGSISSSSDLDSNHTSPTHLTLKIPKLHFQLATTPPATSATMAVATAVTPLSPRKARKASLSSESAPARGGASSLSKSDAKKLSGSVSGRGGKVTRSQAWIREYLEGEDPIKMYLAAVFDYHDTVTGDYVAEPFLLLPSPSLYPDYYKVITQPMDLATIRKNVEVREEGVCVCVF